MPEPHDLLPRPDPTVLTTEALTREIAALRESLERQLGSIKEAVAAEAAAAAALVTEKFRGIQTQFDLLERAADKLDIADKTALSAALQAQKEAAAQTYASLVAVIEKMESGFTKQIDSIGASIAASVASIAGSIDDLKGRLDRGEGQDTGKTKSRADSRSNVGMIVGILGAMFGAIAVAATIIIAVLKGH